MSEIPGSNGEHTPRPEDGRPEVVGPSEVRLLEAIVKKLMTHPKIENAGAVEEFEMPAIPEGMSPEASEDLGEVTWWSTHYQKGDKDIYLMIPEPGSDQQGFDVHVQTTGVLGITESGHRFVESESFEVEQGEVFYSHDVIEFDVEGGKVRTAQDEEEIASMGLGDYRPMLQRAIEEVDLGLQGNLSRGKYAELTGLLNSLTPEDEVEE